MKEVTVQQLKEMMDNGEDFQLIDVREPNEYQYCNLGGQLIPLGTIMNNTDKISEKKKVVIHCRSGGRSAQAVLALQQYYGFNNLYNLRGGISAYADQIDPSIPKY